MALLHVALDALQPPLLLPGVLVALLEEVPGVVVELHVQLIQLLDTLDLTRGKQMTTLSKEVEFSSVFVLISCGVTLMFEWIVKKEKKRNEKKTCRVDGPPL